MMGIAFRVLLVLAVVTVSNLTTDAAGAYVSHQTGWAGTYAGPIVLFLGEHLLPWLAFVPLILLLYQRVSFGEGRLPRFLALHGTVCLLFSLSKGAAHVFLYHPLALGGSAQSVVERLYSGTFLHFRYDVVFYTAVVAVYEAIRNLRKYKQKELNEARLAETLATAQLQSLKVKLQPHFLFNALQSISVLVLEKDEEAATDMLERLGSLLRISMESDESQLVPLDEELQVLDHYLGIEAIRFRDRLHVERRIDEAAREAVVPNLILQPLVENSIRHGISKRIGSGKIDIEICRDGSRLSMEIRNDGPGLEEDWREAIDRGVGLKTTIRRLELMFEDAFKFEMRDAAEGGVVTKVIIPFIENASSADAGGRS
jgi:two-component sensor histidine kinase